MNKTIPYTYIYNGTNNDIKLSDDLGFDDHI